MIKVESLYDSSDSVSSSAIASSNACLARWHARSGEFRICAVSLSLSSECTPRSRTRCTVSRAANRRDAPEVQGETEADRVRRREVRLRNLGRLLVRDVRGLRGAVAAVSVGKLGEVAVVVTLPERRQRHRADTRTHILW